MLRLFYRKHSDSFDASLGNFPDKFSVIFVWERNEGVPTAAKIEIGRFNWGLKLIQVDDSCKKDKRNAEERFRVFSSTVV